MVTPSHTSKVFLDLLKRPFYKHKIQTTMVEEKGTISLIESDGRSTGRNYLFVSSAPQRIETWNWNKTVSENNWRATYVRMLLYLFVVFVLKIEIHQQWQTCDWCVPHRAGCWWRLTICVICPNEKCDKKCEGIYHKQHILKQGVKTVFLIHPQKGDGSFTEQYREIIGGHLISA